MNIVFQVSLLCFAPLALSVPSWEELDRRPLPQWYKDAKFGIFLHWGVFSVPSFGSEWFQEYWQGLHYNDYERFVNSTELPHFSYTEYAHRFRAELYEPEAWAEAFAQAGAQYVVLTSKHHEGFCMWDSRDIPTTWQWNVMDVGPRRDLLGDLAAALRNTTSPMTHRKIHFGVYHSLYEWFNPFYLQDKAANFTTTRFVDEKTMPELYDLVRKYHPSLIWSDGDWDTTSEYWKSREFLHWYGTKSPVASEAVWNDRWGSDSLCKHGSFLTCADRYDPGKSMSKYWEKCMTIDQTSWGYNRRARLEDYLNTTRLVHELVVTTAQNGNLLLNVGPASDGRLPTIFLDRLRGMGHWLKVNGKSIYGTKNWLGCTSDLATKDVYYTYSNGILYAHMLSWPSSQILVLKCPAITDTVDWEQLTIHMLGVDSHKDLAWDLSSQGDLLSIQLPILTPDRVPCQHAWVLALTPVKDPSTTSHLRSVS